MFNLCARRDSYSSLNWLTTWTLEMATAVLHKPAPMVTVTDELIIQDIRRLFRRCVEISRRWQPWRFLLSHGSLSLLKDEILCGRIEYFRLKSYRKSTYKMCSDLCGPNDLGGLWIGPIAGSEFLTQITVFRIRSDWEISLIPPRAFSAQCWMVSRAEGRRGVDVLVRSIGR